MSSSSLSHDFIATSQSCCFPRRVSEKTDTQPREQPTSRDDKEWVTSAGGYEIT
jgi:hypothetical protein